MIEAVTFREFVLSKLQSAGWENDPHSAPLELLRQCDTNAIGLQSRVRRSGLTLEEIKLVESAK
jgi:hypothetical protein